MIQHFQDIFVSVIIPFATLIAGWVGNNINRKRNKAKEENELLLQNQQIRKSFQDEIAEVYELLREYRKADLESTNAYMLLEQKYNELKIDYNALLQERKKMSDAK